MHNNTTTHDHTWSLGSIVKLREPYNACARDWPWNEETYTHGIIVQHLGRGPLGTGRVSLHLYDPDTQRIYVDHPLIPEYVDFNCEELILVKDAREVGYDTVANADFHGSPGFRALSEAFND